MDSEGAYVSKAIVTHVYRKAPNADTIILHTGGNSSAGGRRLNEGESYLIVAGSRNGVNYSAFVCDAFSRSIGQKAKHQIRYKNKTLPIIKHFFTKTKEKYTGELSISDDKFTYAKGKLKNGEPQGIWKHYHKVRNKDGQQEIKVKNESNYKDGLLDGLQIAYWKTTKDTYQTHNYYESGKLVKAVRYKMIKSAKQIVSEHQYQYKGDARYTQYIQYKGADFMEMIRSTVDLLYYKRKIGNPLKLTNILHGPNSSYFPNGILKEEGNYFWGAKIGPWVYFDEEGFIVSEVKYNHPKIEKDSVLVLSLIHI